MIFADRFDGSFRPDGIAALALFFLCAGLGPATTDLIAYYPFTTNAPLLDEAYVLGNLQASGNPSYIPDGPWTASQCAELTSDSDSSGGGQYFTVKSLNLGLMSATNGFSMCTWFVFDATTNQAMIFDFGSSNRNDVLLKRVRTSDTLEFTYYCGWDAQGFYSPNPIINGRWRHVCVVNQDRRWSLYEDGVISVSHTALCSLTNTPLTSNFIGRSNWNSDRLLIGKVDEFRIYQRSISPSDVAYIYALSGTTLHLSATKGTEN